MWSDSTLTFTPRWQARPMASMIGFVVSSSTRMKNST